MSQVDWTSRHQLGQFILHLLVSQFRFLNSVLLLQQPTDTHGRTLVMGEFDLFLLELFVVFYQLQLVYLLHLDHLPETLGDQLLLVFLHLSWCLIFTLAGTYPLARRHVLALVGL